ncbi:hypothetical protein RF11_05226 [Thelohanellus kitauei]|uniref:Uncharacterized protein n=1 Tax=Thelohanellus kitauei TaxID=669202 RepID=A0A0C2NGA6_THEKT|nr:hypothetical protein RF11_05226 [Thelohanellus kitauei]
MKFTMSEFPSDLQMNETLYDVKIDKYNKCLYGHVKKGIFKKCYGTILEIKNNVKFIVNDMNIIGMDFDPRLNHLYFYDKHTITVLHTKYMALKTIYNTKYFIYYLKVDTRKDQLYLSFIDQNSKDILVAITTLIGETLYEYYVGEKIHEIAFHDNYYHIYLKSKTIITDFKSIPSHKTAIVPNNIKLLYVESGDIFISSMGIKLKNEFLLLGNIKRSNYEVVIKSGIDTKDFSADTI